LLGIFIVLRCAQNRLSWGREYISHYALGEWRASEQEGISSWRLGVKVN
jgi:hypothetical protein